MAGEKTNPEIVIYACGGATNVGQIGNDAVRALDQLGHATMACPLAIAAKHPTAIAQAANAAKRVIVDGCENCCLSKEFEAAGLPVDVHFTVTDLGVEKIHKFNYAEEQVAAVASAIRAKIREAK
ncbi:MAG: putative zinc-binding protein [Capsulimonadaceae bacterium]|nr:putative zinc-binding protein [Capsulimonadaceae bacterium]